MIKTKTARFVVTMFREDKRRAPRTEPLGGVVQMVKPTLGKKKFFHREGELDQIISQFREALE
jgi:hypothetical protein